MVPASWTFSPVWVRRVPRDDRGAVDRPRPVRRRCTTGRVRLVCQVTPPQISQILQLNVMG